MINWLAALDKLTREATPAVLVTVAAVQGSGPREPGAKMVVTRDAQFDTIGGGHLEMRAWEVAREMLGDASDQLAAHRRLERFPLGPSLGQCCGGVVHLAFERVMDSSPACGRLLADRWRDRQDSWRMVSLDEPQPPVLLDAGGESLIDGMPHPPLTDLTRGCHVMQDGNGKRWLADPCRPFRPHLVLFGAGHVGAAIVRALAELPCHVTWVDERDDMFPAELPANVKVEATDIPEAVVDAVPAGSSFLVLTHSHALDQRLSEAILRRSDAGWFGLIGSKTKRMQFEHRLLERGIPAQRLADMVCPIGVPGITGKQPAVIAAAVCAQLLQVWEAEERNELQRQPTREAETEAV
ncbi:xanthine dehydrogenase accessory protein XdhC [Noviherbaspirillum sp. CPCC 100848]|uniref:Xanthine dehydrogenase accessory protein XdhC n=1 Tax=Noviherbaspirillum album TaxID=3080276 RepID=A0ABU6JC76_9BURK|nr:xanthine dehydrogenase accessory protein XdhC [Noviherbaspirillum sp. CPCC 100848]MEC4720852.1 xanthine dehydrogenase accessory protein XdhC [Noviherbaspirillum sp. CPCC 100848]